MFIIAGLGNPGRKYVNTRHNIGFDVIDVIGSKHNIKLNKTKHKSLLGEGVIAGEKVVLVKPQTFMNLSGESILLLRDWYKTDLAQILVIYDDVDLSIGTLRIRQKGSSGGHNGMKNIIYHLGSEDFPRIRLGVNCERHPDMSTADFVLGKFSRDEIKTLIPIAIRAADAVDEFVEHGIVSAMNKYNLNKTA